MQAIDPGGRTVLITAGEFAGEEGVCLGPVSDTKDLWAVSPAKSYRIASLRFEEEFGVLINPGWKPGLN